MAETLVVSSVCRQSTNQSEAHLSGGEGLLEEGGANQRSEYCKESLMRGGEELSFEELRAERYQQRKQREMEEKLRTLAEVKQQLSLELEEKKKKLMVMKRRSLRPPVPGVAPPTSSSTVCEAAAAAAARPAGRSCSDQDQDPEHRGGPDRIGLTNRRRSHGGHLVSDCLRPGSRSRSRSRSREAPGPQDRSPLGEDRDRDQEEEDQDRNQDRDQEEEDQDQDRNQDQDRDQGAVDQDQDRDQGAVDQDQDQNQDRDQGASGPGSGGPPHLDLRRRLLELSDVTSCPDCHSEPRPLPAVEENSCLSLGGVLYHVYSRVLEGTGFSVFRGATEQDYALLKVDSSSVLWDLHQLVRLRTGGPPQGPPEGLPRISGFLFEDGSITVYTAPPGSMFTDLVQSASSDSVGFRALALLRLVSELDSCRLVHGALRPPLLTCCHRGFHLTDWVLPVDWSSSVDLDLQPDVVSVQQVPSAQVYVSLGLLDPAAPPQLVDLVGVAETVHLLLTSTNMVPVQDAHGWTAQDFSGDEPCDMYTRMWRRFFRTLLNPGARSPRSILSELKDQLTSLYQ